MPLPALPSPAIDLAPKPVAGPALAPPPPIAPPQPQPPDPERQGLPDGVTLRAFNDPRAIRKAVFDGVLSAARKIQPVSDGRFELGVSDVEYVDPEDVPGEEHKAAILTGRTLGRRMRGVYTLRDAQGNVLDRRKQIIGRVPYVTDFGTIVHKGSKYSLKHQQRLLPGVYTRRKANGELESHVNPKVGQGLAHRYLLDPASGAFKVKVAQAEIPLYPVLQAMGATDDEIVAAWGPELARKNAAARGGPLAIRKLAAKLLREPVPPGQDPAGPVRAAMESMALDPEVTRRTLGHPYATLSKGAVLAATGKLLRVSRGEADVDDRDHLAYQTVLGPEDLFRERVEKDHSRVRRDLLRMAAKTGNLGHVPTGALTRQIEQAFLGSGLGSVPEESSPFELLDRLYSVTRMGEGGLPGHDSVPAESRSVRPSQYGIVDPIRTPESMAAGVDGFFAAGARKGSDGRVYARFLDVKTGRPVWRSPADLADKTVAFTGELKPRRLPAYARDQALAVLAKPAAQRTDEDREILEYVQTFDPNPPEVRAIRGGKLVYVPRGEVDYDLPRYEDAFSPIGTMIPAKSAAKGQRMSMAARMIGQSLALKTPESPLVRSQAAGGEGSSYERDHAASFGAVRAARPGRVVAAGDGRVVVRHDDGTETATEYLTKLPFNRRAFFDQTPVVTVGQPVAPGDLLVKSNFTDDKGDGAYGLNTRIGYLPWAGPANYEDAVVVSDSYAKRMTSSHAYQHQLAVDKTTKRGKAAFLGAFAGKFDKPVLATVGDDGVVKKGTVVKNGDPLVLAIREKPVTGKVHKRNTPPLSDASLVWEYDDPGVVTDVAESKDGPVVVVETLRPMKVGDKVAGRYGDKGIVSKVLPDGQMPYDKEGRALEMLVSPTGINSRGNPSQLIEGALGRLAEKQGKPITIPDFEDVDDLAEWARAKIKAAGLHDQEDLTDPVSGRVIKGVPYGNRYIQKLHHQGEDKLQARDSGGYSADGSPARGGDAGCLHGDTWLETRAGFFPIQALVQARATMPVRTPSGWVAPTDWFERRCTTDELREVEFDDGTKLVLTVGHEVALADGVKLRACQLRPGDHIATA